MAMTTRTHTTAAANVAARSTTWVANEVVRLFQEVVQQRGLPLDYFHEQLDTILKGLRTWITGQWLETATLELWDERTDSVIERYDLHLTYTTFDAAGEERFETHLERIKSQLPTRRPPAGCRYRLVVTTKPGSPDLPGWQPTTLRDASHLSRRDLGAAIETARIGAAMTMYL